MSYSLSVSLALGISKAGLSLRSQLIDTTGANSGSEINSGFIEIGNGYYMWTYDFPDSFQGGVKIYPNGQSANVLGFFTLNPQEAENVDMKISDVSAGAGNNIQVEVGHSNAKGFSTINDTSGVNSNVNITTRIDANSLNVDINDKGDGENTSNRISVNTGVR